MQVEQLVMAYYAEQDRLRALLPEGFVSLRPVLRINAEVRDGVQGYFKPYTCCRWAHHRLHRPGEGVRLCPHGREACVCAHL